MAAAKMGGKSPFGDIALKAKVAGLSNRMAQAEAAPQSDRRQAWSRKRERPGSPAAKAPGRRNIPAFASPAFTPAGTRRSSRAPPDPPCIAGGIEWCHRKPRW